MPGNAGPHLTPALSIRPYVAGYGDLEFDPAGFVLGMVSCILQASYLICVEKSGAEKGVSSVGGYTCPLLSST